MKEVRVPWISLLMLFAPVVPHAPAVKTESLPLPVPGPGAPEPGDMAIRRRG